MRQVDRDVLPLRVALEHAFEGELAADTAFFVTAVGMTWALTEALVHLNPTSLDRMCRAQSPADVVRPDVGGKPVMALIRHAKRIAAIIPSTTQSSLASGKTIEGLLPPSSSDTGTMRSEAARMMSLPTSVEPVKESLLTIGWLASGAPHSSPSPVNTLSTPDGKNS